MDVISGTPQELLSTGNYDAPVIDVSDGDSVVEFGSTIVFETVDSSADEDSGLADMLGGPGLGYHENRSATSRPSTHATPEAMYPAIDLRDRTSARGMSRRQDALREERSQPQRPRHRPNHQMPESMRPRPLPVTTTPSPTMVVDRHTSPLRRRPSHPSPVGYPSHGLSFVRASFDNSSPHHSSTSHSSSSNTFRPSRSSTPVTLPSYSSWTDDTHHRQPRPSRRPTPVQQPSYTPIHTSYRPRSVSRPHRGLQDEFRRRTLLPTPNHSPLTPWSAYAPSHCDPEEERRAGRSGGPSMGVPRRLFSWVERPPRVSSRPRGDRGTPSLPPPSQAGTAHLSTRQSGGRSASEVRGGGRSYWLCSSTVCHHRNWDGKPGERCGNPGCPTRRE